MFCFTSAFSSNTSVPPHANTKETLLVHILLCTRGEAYAMVIYAAEVTSMQPILCDFKS